jgi:hypothetical protein
MSKASVSVSDFELSPRLRATVQHVGREREPLLILDGVMQRPESLVDYAAGEVRFNPAWTASGGFPGLRAPAPLDYVGTLVRSLSPAVEEAFGLENVKLARAECNFSLVTLRPEELTPLQRIPHADTADPLQFAFLHYLCGPRFGGTAFYRHRATGFETLQPDRLAAFEAIRARELDDTPPGPAYIIGHTPHYERIAAADALFDRLIVYRSRTLHSGMIALDVPLSADPRQGRLTANIFVNYRAAS